MPPLGQHYQNKQESRHQATQNLLRSVDVLLRLKEGRFGFLAINTHVFEAHLSWLQWSPPSASTELAEVNVPLRPTQAAAD